MFQLRDEHEQAFQEAAFENFLRRGEAHLRANFPDRTEGRAIGEIHDRIRGGVDCARRYGFESEQAVMCFIDTQQLLGDHFDRDPEHAWTREYLTATTPAPDERAAAMLEHAEGLTRAGAAAE